MRGGCSFEEVFSVGSEDCSVLSMAEIITIGLDVSVSWLLGIVGVRGALKASENAESFRVDTRFEGVPAVVIAP
jgi:hypothetical protein